MLLLKTVQIRMAKTRSYLCTAWLVKWTDFRLVLLAYRSKRSWYSLISPDQFHFSLRVLPSFPLSVSLCFSTLVYLHYFSWLQYPSVLETARRDEKPRLQQDVGVSSFIPEKALSEQWEDISRLVRRKLISRSIQGHFCCQCRIQRKPTPIWMCIDSK